MKRGMVNGMNVVGGAVLSSINKDDRLFVLLHILLGKKKKKGKGLKKEAVSEYAARLYYVCMYTTLCPDGGYVGPWWRAHVGADLLGSVKTRQSITRFWLLLADS